MNQPARHPDIGITLPEHAPVAARRALQRCMRQLVQARVSSLACCDAVAPDEPEVMVERLTRLQCFLNEDDTGNGVTSPARHAPPETPVGAPLVADPLVALLRWQLRLEFAELAAEAPELSQAAVLLGPLLLRQLEAVGRLCARSAWTPDYFVTSGLALHWHHARVLALFCPVESASAGIAALEAECLWLHLHGSVPEAGCKTGLFQEIAKRAHQPFAQALPQGPIAVARPPDVELLCAAELTGYRQLLAAALPASSDAELQPAEQLLTVLYKLAWVTEACGPDPLALVWCCAYQLCSQFWFQHRALPGGVIGVLKNLLAIADARQEPASTSESAWLCQTQLLRHWPVYDTDPDLPIALVASAADAPRVVSLEALPLLLSDSFATLVQVSGEWFVTRAASTADLSPLLQELALLEKGAAAVKVWPLEQLCTLLLELYALVERDSLALPADLLTSAHADLVRLLDQAAAWQETSADSAIIGALQQWLRLAAERRPALSIATPTAAEVTAAQLYQALLAYVRTLALVVEKPVRLHVDPDSEVLPLHGVLQVAEALKPLLRFVLLDNASAAYSRRAAHKPLVHTVSIHLRREAGVLRVLLAEDNEGPLLTLAQTRQLQRSLPPTAGALGCEVHHGQGRWFSFTLAEVR